MASLLPWPPCFRGLAKAQKHSFLCTHFHRFWLCQISAAVRSFAALIKWSTVRWVRVTLLSPFLFFFFFVLFSWDERAEQGPLRPRQELSQCRSLEVSVGQGGSPWRRAARQVHFWSSPQPLRQRLPRPVPSGFTRSEACWGALALAQGSSPGLIPPTAKTLETPGFL